MKELLVSITVDNSGLHSGHNMMRISAPDLVWPQHFFRRLVKLHDRMNRRAASANGGATGQDDPTAADVGEEEPRLPPGGSCRAPRPQGPGRHQGGGAGRQGHHGGRNPFSPPTAGAPHQGGAFRPPFAGQLNRNHLFFERRSYPKLNKRTCTSVQCRRSYSAAYI